MQRPLIFVVDDEPMVLELARLILPQQTYDLRSFRNPQQALDAFIAADPKPALIVTDYAMKEMTGIDLIKACRQNTPGQKILLMSGTVGREICNEVQPGPDAFLYKPFKVSELEGLVRQLVF